MLATIPEAQGLLDVLDDGIHVLYVDPRMVRSSTISGKVKGRQSQGGLHLSRSECNVFLQLLVTHLGMESVLLTIICSTGCWTFTSTGLQARSGFNTGNEQKLGKSQASI